MDNIDKLINRHNYFILNEYTKEKLISKGLKEDCCIILIDNELEDNVVVAHLESK